MKSDMNALFPPGYAEETAAGEAVSRFDRLARRFPPQEAEDIWDAALSAGAAAGRNASSGASAWGPC